MALTLLAFGILLALIALHPFFSYPLSLVLLDRTMRQRAIKAIPDLRSHPARRHTFSICVCAYNEEHVIRRKAENLLQLKEEIPDLEVLIYVDAATDRTVRRLAPFSRDFRIHVGAKRRGKTSGMKYLVARAKGSIVIFTDANVMLDVQSLHNLKAYFSDPQVGCVCGHLLYTNAKASPTANSGSLYWRLEEAIKRLEMRTGSVMGADGSLFAIRRALFKPPPDHIIDDMYVSFSILCEGYRVVQAVDVCAYEESVTSAGEEFVRKQRIACQALNAHRLLWPALRRQEPMTVYKYVSHKYLRWLSIYFLGAADLCLLGGLIDADWTGTATAFILLQIAVAIMGGRYGLKPFVTAWSFITSLTGAGLGIWHSQRGHQFQTWTPAASIRR